MKLTGYTIKDLTPTVDAGIHVRPRSIFVGHVHGSAQWKRRQRCQVKARNNNGAVSNDLTTPHSGYHFDGSRDRFFEGWYWKVVTDQMPAHGRRTTGIGPITVDCARHNSTADFL